MNVPIIFIFIILLSFSRQDGFDKTKFPQVVTVSQDVSTVMAEKLKNKKVTTVTMELDDPETKTYICATDVELRGLEKFDARPKYELGPAEGENGQKVIVTFKFSELFINYGKMTEVTPYCFICWWPYVKTHEKSHPITDTEVSVTFNLHHDSQGVVNHCGFWLIVDGMMPTMQVKNPQYYHTLFANGSFLKVILDKFIGYFALKFKPGNLNKVISYLMMARYRTDYMFAFTVRLDALFQEAASKSGVCHYVPRNEDPSKPPLPDKAYVKSNKFDKYCGSSR